MSVYRIASRYAKSLLDLSLEQNKLEKVLEDMHYLSDVCKVRDFVLMLNNPVVQTDKKLKVFKELFSGKMDSLTEQFIVLVAQKGRERYLPDIATDFVVKYRAYKNIELAKVKSAAPLTSDQQANIQKGLSEMLPKGTSLELELLVDPSLIGGFIIEFGDKVYDASIADKLDEMRKDLFSKNLFVSKIIA